MDNITKDFYLDLMLKLLPKGKAWNFTPDSIAYKILSSAANSFASVHNQANDVLNQLNPSKTTLLIGDFEKLLNLPDLCSHNSNSDLSLSQRQANAYKKYLSKLTNTKVFLEEYSSNLGFLIKVHEVMPDRFDDGFDSFSSAEQENAIIVDILSWPVDQKTHIECEFNKLVPAHIFIFYNYLEQ